MAEWRPVKRQIPPTNRLAPPSGINRPPTGGLPHRYCTYKKTRSRGPAVVAQHARDTELGCQMQYLRDAIPGARVSSVRPNAAGEGV